MFKPASCVSHRLPPRYSQHISNHVLSKNVRPKTDLDDPTDEHVIALVIDPVLQHHFVHHGDKDLVLKPGKVEKEREGVNKRVSAMWWFMHLICSHPSPLAITLMTDWRCHLYMTSVAPVLMV